VIKSLYPKNANGQMAYLCNEFAVLIWKWRIENTDSSLQLDSPDNKQRRSSNT
jgi:hypothetical protein